MGIVALIIGLAIGAGTKSSSSKNTAGTRAKTTTTATVTVSVTASASAAPAAVTPAAAKTTAAPPPAPVAKTVLSVAGNGEKSTANFTVTQDQWTIAYSYDCAAAGGEGNFIVDMNDSTGKEDFEKPGINELGAKGNSSTVEHGAGTYSLAVSSECSWNINVTG